VSVRFFTSSVFVHRSACHFHAFYDPSWQQSQPVVMPTSQAKTQKNGQTRFLTRLQSYATRYFLKVQLKLKLTHFRGKSEGFPPRNH
jgi:hypothetical protein